ncbi:ABC transporter substrate-binding protein [Sutcliffiella rhizosphaerae]|uniref:Solute-binding protein family 5 domain-containing protein n=1 Tax=Sutcliffiella rhizosphaerae TaxID=2880967 RepID=A0ABN8A5T2_9BACI|nr:ABC transporter substrate-binding protein [Sutcliffiella rhizosphaerae]CAG9620384.1 hypothetical protein BACCIP111883_01152 [Sutcliffiella rhizosphaerae]
MKKTYVTFLMIVLLVLSGCINTKSSVSEEEKANDGVANTNEAVEIEVLGMASSEDDLNIVRDQLEKNGFKVKLNIQPDYGSFTAQKDAGNYDIAHSSWTTVTGNPDYAVRALFKSEGANSIMSDEEVDRLIDQASTETPEEFATTYKELEQRLVFDQAYIAPLYNSFKAQGVNTEILKEETVRLAKSRAVAWETIDYQDTSKRDSTPLVTQQAIGTLTSLDPIKGNDGSINTLNTNMYVRLVNLTDDDVVTSDGSLSRNHVIADGNSEYFFLLRDDINFAKITDEKAEDTGERVGADDVIFSLQRASNAESVPDHRTYSLHEHIQDAELVTDLSVLDSTQQSGGEGTVREALEQGIDAKIGELVTDKNDANNQEGKYQVVKVTTSKPFPQVLNYLAHQSAGIVSKQQVENINTYDVASFDPTTDIPYGDQNTVTEGAQFDNHLYASGPYILKSKDDYEATFLKNPAYMPGTDNEANISTVIVKFIQDPDSALSALRNGEIHLFNGVPETKYDLVENDEKLYLQKNDSNAVIYLLFNTENREVSNSEDLRKAILYSINQDEIISFYQNNKKKAVSTVSPLVDTGNELVADPEKVREFLSKYHNR